MTIKVAINGYGTIGKRVADAVSRQDDMEIIGVTKRSPNYEAFDAVAKGYPLYAAAPEFMTRLSDAGLKIEGHLAELLQDADVVVDGTAKKAGFMGLYKRTKTKAIWQGGEPHELTGLSFNAAANYGEALNQRFCRVVSCNTTGLLRTLLPIHRGLNGSTPIGLKRVDAIMIRRGVDPKDSKGGPVNAIEPILGVPSHHGPDVQSVVADIPIFTMAVKVPSTLMHLHCNVIHLGRKSTTEEVLELWRNTPRVRLFSGKQRVKSTAQIMEAARDSGQNRGDLYEIAVWEDGVKVEGDRLYYYQAIHQESDVIPENVDAIRALTGIIEDGGKSIAKTDKALGI